MNASMILHHYDSSPYAEKIRLMFGLTGMRWQSLLSPVWMPRPNLDPLVGGYRRIPVAQIGADLFCDTALIALEIARLTDNPAVDPARVGDDARTLMQQAEGEAFFAGISAVPPARLAVTMMLKFGPLGTLRFAKDRANLLRGGTVRPPVQAEGQATLKALLSGLESHLSGRDWIDEDDPTAADFAVYHPLWLHVTCNRKPLDAGPNVRGWYDRVAGIGHGDRQEIRQADAFAAARDSEPRPLPSSREQAGVNVGDNVGVAPADYGRIPVKGTLAAITDQRIIVRRDTKDFGTLHVHFPRAGYAITPT